MAVTNPFSITWRDLTVGGSSDVYQINGPHTLQKTYEQFLLVFEVVVVATSYQDLYDRCTVLEDAFSTRLAGVEALTLSLDGNDWTYTNGSGLFNAEPTITKSGNPETDYGYARAYTIQIQGDLPDNSGGGLREFEALVSYDPSRRRTVTLRGQYFRSSEVDGVSQYLANIESTASTYLGFVDSDASWELVAEDYTIDRNSGDDALPQPHSCNFTRQYRELIYNQSIGSLDSANIRDHEVTFRAAETTASIGNEEGRQLRRVVAEFVGFVDKENSTDPAAIIEDEVLPFLRQEFDTEYQPAQWAMEDVRKGVDRTGNRLQVVAQFVFQPGGGVAVVDVSQSVGYREIRQIEYTPVHNGSELAAHADVGFTLLERTWDRSVRAVGTQRPLRRITEKAGGGDVGPWTEEVEGEQGPDNRDGNRINEQGWNIVSSVSASAPEWVGDVESGDRMRVVTLTESVVERYHEKPAGGAGGPTTPGGNSGGPITQGGGPPPPNPPTPPSNGFQTGGGF